MGEVNLQIEVADGNLSGFKPVRAIVTLSMPR
jgi:hypothetical protein